MALLELFILLIYLNLFIIYFNKAFDIKINRNYFYILANAFKAVLLAIMTIKLNRIKSRLLCSFSLQTEITWSINLQWTFQLSHRAVLFCLLFSKRKIRRTSLWTRGHDTCFFFQCLFDNIFVSWLYNHVDSNDEMCYKLAQCLKWLTQKQQPWGLWWMPSHKNNPLGHSWLLRCIAIIYIE